MNYRRLLTLADFLEGKGQFEGGGVPKHKFDLALWMSPYEDFDEPFVGSDGGKLITKKKPFVFTKRKWYDQNMDHEYKELAIVECQTAGCAMGWACTIPEFSDGDEFVTLVLDSEQKIGSGTSGQIAYVKNGVLRAIDMDACAKFFDIERNKADHLFFSDSYEEYNENNPIRDPALVAKRIRGMVKEYKKQYKIKDYKEYNEDQLSKSS